MSFIVQESMLFLFTISLAIGICRTTADVESLLQSHEGASATTASMIFDNNRLRSFKERGEKLGYDPKRMDELLARARNTLKDENHMARLRKEAENNQWLSVLNNNTMFGVHHQMTPQVTNLIEFLEKAQKESGRSMQATVKQLVQDEDSHLHRFMRTAADAVKSAFADKIQESGRAMVEGQEARVGDEMAAPAPKPNFGYQFKVDLKGMEDCISNTWFRYRFADKLIVEPPWTPKTQFLRLGHSWPNREGFWGEVRVDNPYKEDMFGMQFPWADAWQRLPESKCNGLDRWQMNVLVGVMTPVCWNCGEKEGPLNWAADQWWQIHTGFIWKDMGHEPMPEFIWDARFIQTWRYDFSFKRQFNLIIKKDRMGMEEFSFFEKLQDMDNCNSLDYLSFHGSCNPNRWQKMLGRKMAWLKMLAKGKSGTDIDFEEIKKLGEVNMKMKAWDGKSVLSAAEREKLSKNFKIVNAPRKQGGGLNALNAAKNDGLKTRS